MTLDVKHLPSDYPKTDVPADWSPITSCNVCGKSWLWCVIDNKDFTCPNCQVVDEDDDSNADYRPGYDDGEQVEPSEEDEETSFE